MKLWKCEMCGKKVLQIQEHHVIPWYLSHDDSDSNIMMLCRSCHRKADNSFDNLILRGKINVIDETRKRICSRYSKKYMKSKQLYGVTLSKYAYYSDMLRYNAKTDVICIVQEWCYNKRRRNKCIGSIINIHRIAKKAASTKGQTTLDGRF